MSGTVSGTDFRVVIPARFDSSRLPGKPLLTLAGAPMVQWVYALAQRSGASQVGVAADDQRIVKVGEAFGGQSVMTSTEHQSGTDRLAEVASAMG